MPCLCPPFIYARKNPGPQMREDLACPMKGVTLECRCQIVHPERCETGFVLQSWITNVSAYVKSQVKQLVTVGEDGFMQASNCLADK